MKLTEASKSLHLLTTVSGKNVFVKEVTNKLIVCWLWQSVFKSCSKTYILNHCLSKEDER